VKADAGARLGVGDPVDLGLALGVVIFEARVLCEALLTYRSTPRTAPARQVAVETIFLKSRSLIWFLYPPDRLDPRDFYIVDFPGEEPLSRSEALSTFLDLASRRCAHLSRSRLVIDLPRTREATGRTPKEWGRTILEEAVAFIARQRAAGIALSTSRHRQHVKRLGQAYRRLTGTPLP
jgi:hypothetical protein